MESGEGPVIICFNLNARTYYHYSFRMPPNQYLVLSFNVYCTLKDGRWVGELLKLNHSYDDKQNKSKGSSCIVE